MDISLLMNRCWHHLTSDNPVRLIQICLGVVGEFFRRTDAFDRQHGVETITPARLWTLDIQSNNVTSGFAYQTLPAEDIRYAIEQAPVDRSACTFIDLGCGKGRPLIVAAEMGFRSIIGVEFSGALVATAGENLHQCRVNAQVICADAAEYQIPDGSPLLVFMANPFGEEVVSKVVKKLTLRSAPTWVVYANPRFAGCFEGSFPLVRRGTLPRSGFGLRVFFRPASQK